MILKIIRPSAVSALNHFRVAEPEGLFFSHHGHLIMQNWKQGFYPSFGITHQCSESYRRWLSVVNVFCGGFPVWMGVEGPLWSDGRKSLDSQKVERTPCHVIPIRV
jgi:hypothetical protein